jgi:hypothetical protein
MNTPQDRRRANQLNLFHATVRLPQWQSIPLEARENVLRLTALMLRGHLHLSEDDEEVEDER